jgi:CHRD domain
MLTKYFGKHKFIQLGLLLGVLIAVLAACSSNDSSNTSGATPSVLTSASAVMRHNPSGTLQLSWDSSSHILMAQVALTGLAPSSIHPTRIYEGSCRNPGKEAYPLKNVVANNIGFANAVTRITDVTGGIPANGWYVDVHNGPTLSNDAQSLAIACADVTNPSASTKSNQSVVATLGSTSAADQGVTGTAQLSVNNGNLTITVSLNGMEAHSTHMLHIHTGSCASQGKVVYTLKPVIADAAGAGTSTTVISHVSAIPQSGWYVNAHMGPDLSKQTGFDPISCGDITTLH